MHLTHKKIHLEASVVTKWLINCIIGYCGDFNAIINEQLLGQGVENTKIPAKNKVRYEVF